MKTVIKTFFIIVMDKKKYHTEFFMLFFYIYIFHMSKIKIKMVLEGCPP